MTPLPAVLALGDSWVHIHSSNSGDKTSNIKVSVD